MKPQSQVCGARSAILAQCHPIFSSSTAATVVVPPESILIRSIAHSFCSGDKKPAPAGVSGMKKKQMMPNATVIAPSTNQSVSSVTLRYILW
jgi:hypothetical protein